MNQEDSHQAEKGRHLLSVNSSELVSRGQFERQLGTRVLSDQLWFAIRIIG